MENFRFCGFNFERRSDYYNVLTDGMITGGLSIKQGEEIYKISQATNALDWCLLEDSDSYLLTYLCKVVKEYY